jgi:hypothetical protein
MGPLLAAMLALQAGKTLYNAAQHKGNPAAMLATLGTGALGMASGIPGLSTGAQAAIGAGSHILGNIADRATSNNQIPYGSRIMQPQPQHSAIFQAILDNQFSKEAEKDEEKKKKKVNVLEELLGNKSGSQKVRNALTGGDLRSSLVMAAFKRHNMET